MGNQIDKLDGLLILMEKNENYKHYFYSNFLDHKNYLSKVCHKYFKTLQYVYDYYVLGC